MQDRTDLIHFLKALSDPTRLRIVEYLAETGQPRCVGAISKHVGVTQSATSQHLRILRQSNFVTSARRGYHIHYEINQEAVNAFLEQLRGKLGK
ncbi:MAG: metalloregulator ArsR/SmtB family transcription factor [Marinilabilia sp.]